MSSLMDPFYIVKQEVMEALQAVGEMFERWKDLLENSNTSTNDDFKWVSNELKTGVRGIEADLTDLEETISVAEKDKIRFRIDDVEITNRRAFVSSSKKRLQAIKDEMNSPKTKGKLDKDSRSLLLSPKSDNRHSKYEESVRQDNQDFIDGQSRRQQMIMQDQEQDLSQLSNTVVTLKEIGVTVGKELDSQRLLIEDIEGEVDKANSGLKGAVKKVNQLLDSTRDSTQIGIIVLLILVLIGLGFAVYYI